MKAPFPYHGGKSRHAARIWQELGDPDVYVEPFAGSLAVLLNRAWPEPARREVVCDKDANIVNFWRALAADPHCVARWADAPTFHQECTARHRWIQRTNAERAAAVRDDPDYYDVRAAGYWVHGVSNWIGGGYGTPNVLKKDGSPWEDIPHASGAQGVQVARPARAEPHDRAPYMRDTDNSGRGVTAQRAVTPDRMPSDYVPYMAGQHAQGKGVTAQRANLPERNPIYVSKDPGGMGVQAQRIDGNNQKPDWETIGSGDIGTGQRLFGWFEALAQRLARVIVLDRDWTSALTPSVLMLHSKASKRPSVSIFLDPPYRTDTDTYHTDLYGDREHHTDVATAAYEWALEHGGKYRIAYAMNVDDFPVPDGWTYIDWQKGTSNVADDRIIFSPACVGGRQLGFDALLDGA